jgi:hypothetical protein
MADDRHASYAAAGRHAPGGGLRSLEIILTAVLACALLTAPSPVESHDIYVGVSNKPFIDAYGFGLVGQAGLYR